jgi:hypothetical protein
MKILKEIGFWLPHFTGMVFISVCTFALVVGFDAKLRIGQADKKPSKELISKADSLETVVKDLEAKVEILNRYLVQKHIEYIDACDLKTKPQ